MISIKNRIFNDSAIVEAIHKMTTTTKFGVPITLAIVRLKRAWDHAYTLYDETRSKYVLEYCDKGEDGKPIVTKFNNQIKYSLSTGGYDAFSKAMTELESLDGDLAVDPIVIKESQLPEGVLSAADIVALTGIVDFVPDKG